MIGVDFHWSVMSSKCDCTFSCGKTFSISVSWDGQVGVVAVTVPRQLCVVAMIRLVR